MAHSVVEESGGDPGNGGRSENGHTITHSAVKSNKKTVKNTNATQHKYTCSRGIVIRTGKMNYEAKKDRDIE